MSSNYTVDHKVVKWLGKGFSKQIAAVGQTIFTFRRIVLFTNRLTHGIVKAILRKGRNKC